MKCHWMIAVAVSLLVNVGILATPATAAMGDDELRPKTNRARASGVTVIVLLQLVGASPKPV